MAMHIGLIGGIGPAATDFYYRRLIAAFAGKEPGLELTMAHADTPTLLRHLGDADAAGQVEIYLRLTNRLKAAGAELVVVTSIAGHFCIREFEPVSPLPVVNLVQAVGREIEAQGLARLGILGTRTAMESHFYGAIPAAEIIPPRGQDLDDVHAAYVAMASAGVVTAEQRDVFERASGRLMREEGAEAILLGGTDLALAFDEGNTGFPVIDCVRIHVDAIVRMAGAGPGSKYREVDPS